MLGFDWRLPLFCIAPDAGGGAGASGGDPPEGDPPTEPKPDDKKTEKEEELEKALAAKDNEIKRLKAQQAGEYKHGQELQRQIDELKKAQMSEEERKKAEAEELEKQRREPETERNPRPRPLPQRYRKEISLRKRAQGRPYTVTLSNFSFPHSLHRGQFQLSGIASKAVPGATPLSGSPLSISYT